MSTERKKRKVEYGDFQTPFEFARRVCAFLAEEGIAPASILEPTCGQGAFLLAALAQFREIETAVGVEINPLYVNQLQEQVKQRVDSQKIKILHEDFFAADWSAIMSDLPDPLLIIGNPPWVNNAELGVLGSANLPPKRNDGRYNGIEAITGVSNFDISEWMLRQAVGWLEARSGVIAMLCKTTVARRVMEQIWQNRRYSGAFQIHLFDAKDVFNAAVDACLLIYDGRQHATAQSCPVYDGISPSSLIAEIGYKDDQLIAHLPYYKQWRHLQNRGKALYQWRSGIKHDCAAIMELEKTGAIYHNKLGDAWELEESYLYPMLKSSDIAAGRIKSARWMLLPQANVGDNTLAIQRAAPRTWAYLQAHSARLDERKSSIYKNRPRFAIFGVGDYSFSPWKVVISGLYKRLTFTAVGPQKGKPTVLDDTCYFIPCHSQAEAELLTEMLNSEPAQQFYQAFIFWDTKRPITAKILQKLDLHALAVQLGQSDKLAALNKTASQQRTKQLSLFADQQI